MSFINGTSRTGRFAEKMALTGFQITKIIFAVVFSIPLIIWGFLLADHIACKNLATNGVSATADVIGIYQSAEVNGESYYSIKYVFKDANGVDHKGETDACYTFFEAHDIQTKTKTLQIKYDPDTFESVRADYDYSSDRIILIILPIFGIVGVGFWVWLIVGFCSASKSRKTALHGEETVATFITCGTRVTVNGCPYYYMEYQFENANGDVVKRKTPSKYTIDEVRFFQAMRTFRIKTYKNHVAIIEPIDLSKIDLLESQNNGVTKRFKKCAYCGSVIDENEKQCPSCGARKFEKVK